MDPTYCCLMASFNRNTAPKKMWLAWFRKDAAKDGGGVGGVGLREGLSGCSLSVKRGII